LETYYGLNKNYNEALVQSGKIGDIDLVKYFLKKGADLEYSHSGTVLGYAAYYGHLVIIKYLVSLGANIRADNDYAKPRGARSLVRYAARNGHLETVKYLIEDQKVNITTEKKYYIFKLAAQNGHLNVIKYFTEQKLLFFNKIYFKLFIKKYIYNNSICYAARYGHLETVKYLIEDQKVNITTEKNMIFLNWLLKMVI
jgi:ankyrin repeat protein